VNRIKNKESRIKGFTLIELLVVIAIISILAVIVFVALDPITRLAEARNSRRWGDVNNLLTAMHECLVDNDGALASCGGVPVAGETYEIVSDASSGCDDVCTGVTSDTHCADLDTPLVAYLKTLPTDPGGVTAGHTEYSISIDSNNIITITACSAENSAAISVSR